MATMILHVGGSAVRAIVAEPSGDGSFQVLGDHRVALGFERAIRCSGEIGVGRRQLAEETVKRLSAAAFKWGADTKVGVVDASLSSAKDLDALIGGIENVLGVPLEVRSQEEAARLVVAAAARSVASTELRPVIEFSDHQLRWSGASHDRVVRGVVPLGIDDLVAVDPDPLGPTGRQAAVGAVAALLRCPGVPSLVPALPDGLPLVVSGPAVVAVASSVLTRRWGPQRPYPEGVHVTRADLAALEEALAEHRPAGRLLLPGVDPVEVDRVAVTVLLLRELTQRVGADGVIVTLAEPHDGEVLRALGLICSDEPTRLPPSERVTPSQRPVAATEVRSLAVEVFDHLQSVHGLGAIERDLVARASGFIEAGTGTSVASHRRSARDLLDGGMRGVTPERLVEVACLVRFQRGRPPGPHFAPYGRLIAARRQAVDRMTGLLRLTSGLGATYGSNLLGLEVAADSDAATAVVRIHVRDPRAAPAGQAPVWLSAVERLLGIGLALRPVAVLSAQQQRDVVPGAGPTALRPA